MHHRFMLVATVSCLLAAHTAQAAETIDWAGSYAVSTTYAAGPSYLCGHGANLTWVMQDATVGTLYFPDQNPITFNCVPVEEDVIQCSSAAQYTLFSAEFHVALRSNNSALAGSSVVNAVVHAMGNHVTCSYNIVGYRQQ